MLLVKTLLAAAVGKHQHHPSFCCRVEMTRFQGAWIVGMFTVAIEKGFFSINYNFEIRLCVVKFVEIKLNVENMYSAKNKKKKWISLNNSFF